MAIADESLAPKKPHRGCGVCKSRKVLCDRTLPACNRCFSSNRTCDGYNLKLSWPRKSDRRRAMLVSGNRLVAMSYLEYLELINVTSSDIELHLALSPDEIWEYTASISASSASSLEDPLLAAPILNRKAPTLGASLRWMPYELKTPEKRLLEYFESVVSTSLWTLGDDNTRLRHTLIRMALSSSSSATSSVLLSLLTLSSVHLNGLQAESLKYHAGALSNMRRSAAEGLKGQDAYQHLAASMLLGESEHWVASTSYISWASYLTSSRDLIHYASISDSLRDDKEFNILLDWLHYQYVLGTFTVAHWPGPCAAATARKQKLPSKGLLTSHCASVYVPYPDEPAHVILHLLLKIIATVVEPFHPAFYTEAYRKELSDLERQIKAVPVGQNSSTTSAQVTELYQLAVLVYLERCSQTMPDRTEKVEGLVNAGFEILGKMETCSSPFVLMMLGAEARTDEERLMILGLLSRYRRSREARDLTMVRDMIEFVWTQDDLGTRWPNNFVKMRTVFRTCSTVPALI